MTGLRERKKQRTRDALVRAAHELFVSQGYEDTTVDEIADAVDVSQRTFFRYFSSKEEVTFALQRLIDERYFEAVHERPAGEAPVEVLRHTLNETWESIGEDIQQIVPLHLHMRMRQIIETTPALVAAHLRYSAEMEERLAAEIAHRENVDIDADPRPRVLVAAYIGVMRAAGRHWGAGGDVTVEAERRCIESYVNELAPALGGTWDHRPANGQDSGGDGGGPQLTGSAAAGTR